MLNFNFKIIDIVIKLHAKKKIIKISRLNNNETRPRKNMKTVMLR